MANQEHLAILNQDVEAWNQWRQEHPRIQPDLSDADLSAADLSGANLRYATLSKADLSGADLSDAELLGAHLNEADLSGADLSAADLSDAELWKADLSAANLRGADLSGANLRYADLSQADLVYATFVYADLLGAHLNEANLSNADLSNADLSDADLSDANLSGANLRGATLSGANLRYANLSQATLVETNLPGATLTACSIYGISAWNVQLEGAKQDSLRITRDDEPAITVDDLEVAQFIYLLLNNKKIREVIDTITSKVVLILGRFTPERKIILDALKDALRAQNYSPIVFDFEIPGSRDITETVSTLAHLARFVIADITDAKSIPQELMIIVPNLPSVPILPLILDAQHEYGMFEHFTRFPWVLPVFRYADEGSLLKSLQEKVIIPAEEKAKELEKR